MSYCNNQYDEHRERTLIHTHRDWLLIYERAKEAQVLYHIQSGLCLSRQAPSDGDVVLGLDECGAEGITVDIRA